MAEVRQLLRDAARVQQALQELPDGRVVTTLGCKIHVPARFIERGLAYVGVENYILGIYAIITEDLYYGVSLVNAMINIDPSEVNRIKVKGDDYLEFVFAPGATVFKSTNLVKNDNVTYRIYDEILAGGRIPWYVGYEELGHLFDTAMYHAGANIGSNQEVTQMIASIVARDPDNRNKAFRTRVKEASDLDSVSPTFVPLKSIEFAASNTVSRMGGNYMATGIVASLLDPSTRVERIESLLRK